MRRLRITIVILFVLSGIAFIGYNIANRILSDHTPPVITSDSDTISVSVAAEDSELLAGLTATDNKDGDITDSIRISSMSNFTEPGKRTISYAVFDSSNQAATLTRNLEYTDYVSPKIHQTQPLRFSLNEMDDANLAENMTAEDCIDGDHHEADQGELRRCIYQHCGQLYDYRTGEQQRGRYLFSPCGRHGYGSDRFRRAGKVLSCPERIHCIY